MDFLRTLLQDVHPDGLLLDIGANEGGYTWLMRKHCPENTILAFEPIPALWTYTQQRYAADPRIDVWPLGVSDHVGVIPGVACHEAWTLVAPEGARRGRNAISIERDGPGTFDMRVTTVDDVVAQRARGLEYTERVDFLKIDTDGYERRVLRGARETLRRDRPPVLIELGYLVNDLGDSIDDFLRCIYQDLDYRLYTQDGAFLDFDTYERWYPFHTTFDVAMLPAEIPLRPLE